MLEAGLGAQFSMWVNGERFDFSANVITQAGELTQVWSRLAELVQIEARRTAERLRCVLVDFDVAMADFEHKYIYELMVAEQRSKSYLQQAIQEEHALRKLKIESSRAYKEGERRLVRCLCALNSVANQRRKGRDDLNVEILHSARATLRRCTADEAGADASNSAAILAEDVVKSYEALRTYLQKVETCLERVDPHLCNNSGLVERLVDWEEAWERGARYVQDQDFFAALCDTFKIFRHAQAVAPGLNVMIQECNSELFLVLPRIVWLRFLFTPGSVLKLLWTMLPHRFVAAPDNVQQVDVRQIVDEELGVFMDQFQDSVQVLTSGMSISSEGAMVVDAEAKALDVLIQRSVSSSGSSCQSEVDTGAVVELQQNARNARDSIVHGMEKWSIELQRHCPDDWNPCCAIMVQCLMGADEQAPSATHDQNRSFFKV
jgi:hypothetical protein